MDNSSLDLLGLVLQKHFWMFPRENVLASELSKIPVSVVYRSVSSGSRNSLGVSQRTENLTRICDNWHCLCANVDGKRR